MNRKRLVCLWSRILTACAALPCAAALAQTATVSVLTALPTGPKVIVSQTQQDTSGTTSVRFYPNDTTRELKFDSVVAQHYYARDRDLGQIFTVGSVGGAFDAVTVRVGPSAQAVGAGAPGSSVAIQVYKLTGTASLNNAGSSGSQTARWQTYAPSYATTDDYYTGINFQLLQTFTGAILPSNLAANQYLRFNLTPNSVVLEPNTRYAFLVLFEQPGVNRSFSLANKNRATNPSTGDPYTGGWGIRREGSQNVVSIPGNVINAAVFAPDINNPSDMQTARNAASFGSGRMNQIPGTIGLPDVDTWRDLVFAIELQ